MIKFFRHIRKKLVGENRFTKYLIYAIGEIVLVVIGILIALQVNTLNENKKQKELENKILNELLVDLNISKADLENDILVNKRMLATAESLKTHIHNKKPYYNTLEEDMLKASDITQFSPRTSGYQNLKSEGVSLISDDNLRKEICNLFEINFPAAVNRGREYDQHYNSRIDMDPFFKKYFVIDMEKTAEFTYDNIDYTLKTNLPVINDYSQLVSDTYFINILQKTIYDRSRKIVTYLMLVKKIDNVNSLISQELKKEQHD